ncbi:hypothetical protein AKJ09_10737 [Labilithrix luteola]|uniref:Uncharacterized protein n=1 Tax=Labilithrix luteola TaxID=1391654 RepID=A0A0K1QE85_9BACT|nr:hypothetical protein [Labilithrix luteola]AKV04074.1 hypothetical protein AKJ09_10737 [Labilithrix luteola]
MIAKDALAIVLLGAQRYNPTLGAAVDELGVAGRIATITAGWQEREDDDADLRDHLGARAVNLKLHARAEEIFRKDPEFAEAHRERQAVLRSRQDFYRIRLEHALAAQYVIEQRKAPPDILEDEARASIEAIRNIDNMHLDRCARDRTEFEDKLRPWTREAILEQREQVASIVRECDAIAIAGGHVASLLNRLQLFNLEELSRGKVIFAWCAGAMAISERVVLFHDSPPQGPGAAEVLDAGLGLVGGVVVLPQPEFRLKLDDRARLKLMARRFQPAMCLGMPARSRVTWLRSGPIDPYGGVFAIRDDGTHAFGKTKAVVS